MLARIKARIEELKAAIMIPECIPAKTNQSPCGHHIAQREELAFLEGLAEEIETRLAQIGPMWQVLGADERDWLRGGE